jgi:hypothetical protein
MMRYFFILIGVLAAVTLLTLNTATPLTLSLTPQPTAEATADLHDELFDDFHYTAHDDPALHDNGWIVRTADGWPGVPGAVWRAENVSFIEDPDDEDNRLLQMTSSVVQGVTYQTQICQQRKFYEGTYATRIYFTNAAAQGPDGDQVVQTFYLISPQEYDLDPDYSELDFEYLPNGGWGFSDPVLFATTWETFQLDPWIADNTSRPDEDDYSGWHTLAIQIFDGTATYYVDGERYAAHTDEFYPEVPMSINYNLWFIRDGQIDAAEAREYVERVDWVYFAADVALTPQQIEARVEALREDQVRFSDSVPQWSPPLESPCNF